MTLQNHRRRRLVVNGLTFFWRATGNDNGIGVVIEAAADGRRPQRLLLLVDYVEREIQRRPDGGVLVRNEQALTPGFVREAIEFALSRGWAPFGPAPERMLWFQRGRFLERHELERTKGAV
jgi:hypothetical protein